MVRITGALLLGLAACAGSAGPHTGPEPAPPGKLPTALRRAGQADGLTVERDRVSYNGEQVARLEPGDSRCPLLPRLRRRLGRRERLPLRTRRDVPFNSLCSAAMSAWAAGASRVALAVEGSATVELLAPLAEKPGALNLTVVIGQAGLFVAGAGGVLPGSSGSGPTLPRRTGGEQDWAGLKRRLKDVKQTYPEETRVTLTAEAAVPVGMLLGAVRAVRPVFAEVALDSFDGASARVARGKVLEQVGGVTRLKPRPRPPMAVPPRPPSRLPGPVPPAISGPGPASAAAVVIQAHRAQIRACYEQCRQRTPAARGAIALRLTSGSNGQVVRVEVASDSIGDAQLTSCLKAEAGSWVLPEAGAVYLVPLVFRPR